MRKKITIIALLLVASILVTIVLATPISTTTIDNKVGSFTGPVGGTAQDDNIKASLDLAHTDLDTIIAELGGAAGIATWPTAAKYANAVSMAEVLGYVQDGVRRGDGASLPADKSLFDIIGETYTDDGGGDHLDDVYAHLNLIMKYVSDGTGGGAVVGASLPAGKSLFDIIGETYTDDGGADHLDDVASHINLVMKYVADGAGSGAASGAALPSGKSLFDIIGETYTDDGGADHLDDVASHINLVMKYLADGSGGGAVVGASLPAGKSLFDIIGDEYTDDGGNDNADSVAAHLNLLSKYIADGDGDFATGATLPANKSLYDLLGAYTGDGGADDEDTIMAHLDLIYGDSQYIADLALPDAPTANSLAAFIASGGTALGTELADSKSIVDAIGTNGTTVADTATGLAGMIGVNDNDNAMDTSNVTANGDGSVYERLEFVQQQYTVSKSITAIDNGNDNLFTVAGGPIQIVQIVAYVDTAIGAESNKVNFNVNPTVPAADTAFGTDGDPLETNGDAEGTLWAWNGTIASDLVATTNGVALTGVTETQLIVPPGTIQVVLTNDNAVDGAFTVYMTYRPLGSNVTVVPAS